MRIWSRTLLFLATMSIPWLAHAQQTAAPSSNNAGTPAAAQAKSDTVPAAPPKENFAAPNDLQTGLHEPIAEVLQEADHGDFLLQLVRVQWRLGDPIDLWIARPKFNGRVPVVLYLYSHTDTDERFRNEGWGRRATAGEFAAVGFVPALTDYRFKGRGMRQWFVSELQESLGTSVHDVQLVLNYLASRGDMDMSRVGMFGQGAGGTVAILAAHADDRIKTLDVLDPWGDWANWVELSPAVPDNERPKYLRQEFLKPVVAMDPITVLPTLKTPNFRLQQTMSEPVTPNICKEHIAAAMPRSARLVKYAGPEDLMKAWQVSGLSGWIKQQMRPQTSGGSTESGTAIASHNGEKE